MGFRHDHEGDKSTVSAMNGPSKLELTGWAKKVPSRPTNRLAESHRLEMIMQGPDTFYLDWKVPRVGSRGVEVPKSVTYRREALHDCSVFGRWGRAGMTPETHAPLISESQWCQIAYRMVYVDTAGDSALGNAPA